jgi:WhiB family redox-sensing transcriptional regulator
VDNSASYQQVTHSLVLYLSTGSGEETAPMRFPGGSANAGFQIERELSPDWRDDALCVRYVGEVDFFPARGESTAAAKAVCAACPVRDACLEYALRADIHCGVWGGLSELERRQLRRTRRREQRNRHLN